MGIMLTELGILYEAEIRGITDPLEPLKIQYIDYAIWQKNWLGGNSITKQMNFWKQKLSGNLPILNLPCDFPRPLIPNDEGDLKLAQSRNLMDGIYTLSKQAGTGSLKRVVNYIFYIDLSLYMAR